MGKSKITFADEFLVDKLISSQRSSIRYHLIFAAGVFFLGILIIGLCIVFAGGMLPESFKVIIGIGSGFVSSLSAFQLKEILQCRNKIGVFENVRIRMKKLSENVSKSDPEEQTRIKELMWKIIEQTAIG